MQPQEQFTKSLHNYFLGSKGGRELLDSLLSIPEAPFANLISAIKSLEKENRIYFFGNGGSFDNARFFAAELQKIGVNAFVPAIEGGYADVALEQGHAAIYLEGLKSLGINHGDIAVGISGSGNSENVNSALLHVKENGGKTFCFGGRDGGKMARICGRDNAVIAPNDCMEIIEDLHLACGVMLRKFLQRGTPLLEQKKRLANQIQSFYEKNIGLSLPHLVDSVLKTIERENRLFVLGHTIGANHFRADMMRGATARIPIRGVNAPELYTANSFQATANDDGAEYTLIRGFLKHTPNTEDFTLLFCPPGSEKAMRLCEEELNAQKLVYMKAGNFSASGNTIDLSFFNREEIDFGIALLGHATSVAINEWLSDVWDVSPLELKEREELKGRKKLNRQETLLLEERLREEGVLEKNRILSFCYGKVYSVKAPEGFLNHRFFY